MPFINILLTYLLNIVIFCLFVLLSLWRAYPVCLETIKGLYLLIQAVLMIGPSLQLQPAFIFVETGA